MTMTLQNLDPNDNSRRLSIRDAIKAHERGKLRNTKEIVVILGFSEFAFWGSYR